MANESNRRKDQTAERKVLHRADMLPKPLVGFMGFAFLQCWILATFSSDILFGSAESLPALALYHGFASLVSFAIAFLVLMCTLRLVPLSRNRELGLVASFVGMAGCILLVLSTNGTIDGMWTPVSLGLISICATVLSLSWQEYFATQGARAAMFALALSTLAGAILFFLLVLAPRQIAVVATVLLPFAAAVSLRPQRGARYFVHEDTDMTTGKLCRTIAHDYSPRLMTVFCLVAFVYGAIRVAGMPQDPGDASLAWIRSAAGLSLATVVACVAVMFAQREGVVRAFYVALPLSAVGVIAFGAPVSGHAEISLCLVTCGYTVVNYLVWLVMMERSFSKKLPVLGLFASLWMAGFAGILVGQAVCLIWPFGYAAFSYLLLLAVLAAALLMVSMGGRLALSPEVLNAPTPRRALAQRVEYLVETFGLSPREREITEIWLEGHNAVYIEETLHISRNTIKTHLSHIYQKTGTSNREELIAVSESEPVALR